MIVCRKSASDPRVAYNEWCVAGLEPCPLTTPPYSLWSLQTNPGPTRLTIESSTTCVASVRTTTVSTNPSVEGLRLLRKKQCLPRHFGRLETGKYPVLRATSYALRMLSQTEIPLIVLIQAGSGLKNEPPTHRLLIRNLRSIRHRHTAQLILRPGQLFEYGTVPNESEREPLTYFFTKNEQTREAASFSMFPTGPKMG